MLQSVGIPSVTGTSFAQAIQGVMISQIAQDAAPPRLVEAWAGNAYPGLTLRPSVGHWLAHAAAPPTTARVHPDDAVALGARPAPDEPFFHDATERGLAAAPGEERPR